MLDIVTRKIFHELSWLGGIIDGEGCLMLQKTKFRNRKGELRYSYQPQIQITNTNVIIIEKIIEIYKKYRIHCTIEIKRPEINYKKRYILTTEGQIECGHFIDLLNPHIIGKKLQAALLWEFLIIRSKKKHKAPYSEDENDVYDKMKQANERGNPQNPSPHLPTTELGRYLVDTTNKSYRIQSSVN